MNHRGHRENKGKEIRSQHPHFGLQKTKKILNHRKDAKYAKI